MDITISYKKNNYFDIRKILTCYMYNFVLFWVASLESVSNGQCLVNLCLNGGTCSAYMNTYRCHCPNGFQGKHCEGEIM